MPRWVFSSRLLGTTLACALALSFLQPAVASAPIRESAGLPAGAAVQAPDLVPVGLTAPAVAVPGQAVEVTWMIRNQGTVDARPTWYEALYLSTDAAYDEQDTYIGFFYRSILLAAGASYGQARTVDVPRAAPGNYFFILRADATGNLAESDEANNDRAISITLVAPDLAPIGLSAPATAEPGQAIEITWMARNEGTGDALPSWYDGVYLSTDDAYDGQDRRVGEYRHSLALAAGASYGQALGGWLPQVAPGSYFLILRANAGAELAESDQTNNDRAIPITLAAADLAPMGLTAPITAAPGRTIEATWRVGNQGAGVARPPWHDYLYLSTDDVYDAQDTYLGYSYQSRPIATGESYDRAQAVALPQAAAGSYYLILRTDAGRSVAESDEANNDRGVPMAIAAPDLAPAGLAAPAAAGSGQSIEVTWSVLNRGNGDALPAWYDYLYLSTDDIYDGQDECVGNFQRQLPLPAGARYDQAQTIRLAQVAAGSYYLVLRSDAGANLAESDETNNDRAIPIRIVMPDLVPAGLTAPAAAAAGQSIEVAWRVENQGSGVARPTWYDYLYLSSDDIYDTGDTYIGNSYRTAPVAAGADYGLAQTVALPQVAAGDYYLILRVDPGGSVAESDKTNNDRAAPIAVGAPERIPGDVRAAPGNSQVVLTWSAVAGASAYNVYYATVPGVTRSTGTKIANATSPYTHTGLVNGTPYYYAVTAVVSGVEGMESQPASAVPAASGTGAADLAPIGLSGPVSATTQQDGVVTWMVANQGRVDAQAGWYDQLYLSANAAWDGSDVGVATIHRSMPVAVSGMYAVTAAVVMPSVPAGPYYLIIRTDSSSQIPEVNESNNTRAIPITITMPDLAPIGLSGPVSATTQQLAEVGWVVTNQGTGEAQPSWNDQLYLSANPVWDASDTSLAWAYRSFPVAVAGSYAVTALVTLPRTPAGSYYLIVRSDSSGSVYESSESNNTRAVPITITTPDLTPIRLTGPVSATTQHPVEVGWAVANQGTGEAQSPWNDGLYLSANPVWDASDTSLASVYRTLPAGVAGGYVVTVAVTLPNVPAGSYYLIVRPDSGDSVYESSESNNARAIPITMTTPDLAPIRLSGPVSATTGQEVEVGWVVTNQGAGEAQPAWYDQLYLSANAAWDSSDVNLATVYRSFPLPAAASCVVTAQVTLPGAPAGPYYLILRSDSGGSVYESNEANNTRSAAIQITTPDLTPIAVSGPVTATPQQPIEVGWVVANQGAGTAQASWGDRIYLSTDTTWDSSDISLNSAARSLPLPAGSTYVMTTTAAVPSVPPGSYYLLVRVDDGDGVYEADENNNDLAAAIHLDIPDLAPVSFTAPLTAAVQQRVDFAWTVHNQGTGDGVPSWTDRLYLSRDDTWDNQDAQLGAATQEDSVSAGDAYSLTLEVTLPSVSEGRYYLILHVDDGGRVYESNEANNEMRRAIDIRVPAHVDTPWRALDSAQSAALGHLDFSPDGLRLAAAGGASVFMWDVERGVLRPPFTAHSGQVDTVDFSPVGGQVLSGARDGTSRIWDAATRQQVRTLAATPYQPNPAAFSADGALVLAGSGLNRPRLWDAVSGAEVRSFAGHSGVVNAVALSSDGAWALTGSADRTAIVWDVQTGARRFTLAGHDGPVNTVAFSPDGASALTGSSDGSVRVWNMADGALKVRFIQGSSVIAAVFSPDGRYVVSCGGWWPGTAYLWDTVSGALIRTFDTSAGSNSSMNGVAMSPDRTLIATSQSDGQVQLWQSGLGAVPLHPVMPLTVGAALSLTLQSYSLRYYELDVEAGRSLLLALNPITPTMAGPSAGGDAPDDLAAVRIAVRYGGLPSAYQYDLSAEAPASRLHAEVPVAPTQGGRYYVLVLAPYLPAGSLAAAISAEYVDFHVSDITPGQAGNAGQWTAEIRGTGLSTGTLATLIAPSGTRLAGAQKISPSPTRLFATFDLRSATPGAYTLEVQRPGDGAANRLASAVQVVAGGGGQIETSIVAPHSVRQGRTYAAWVEIRNIGNNDLDLPLFAVDVTGTQAVRLSRSGPNLGAHFTLLAPPQEMLLPVYPPGTIVRIPFFFEVSSSATALQMTLSAAAPAGTGMSSLAIDYAAIPRPPDVPAEAWSQYLAELQSRLGADTSQYYLRQLASLRDRQAVGGAPYALAALVNSRWMMIPQADQGAVPIPPVTLPPALKEQYRAAEAAALNRALALPAARPAQGASDTYVVIVTDKDYSQQRNHGVAAGDLDAAPRDGQALYDYYRYTLGVPADHITWLNDGSGAGDNLTSQQVYDAIAGVYGKGIDGNDNLVVAYNGHGMQGGDWVVNDGTISASGLATAINQLGSGQVAVISDSCFAGAFLQHLDGLVSAPFAGFGATDGSTYSYGSAFGLSEFMGAFLKHLNEGDTVQQAMDDATREITDRYKNEADPMHRQHPVLVNNDGLDWSGNPWGIPRDLLDQIRDRLGDAWNWLAHLLGHFGAAVVRPIDPNDKIGPPGIGASHIVAREQTLQYTIDFENQSTASAPVQELVVVDYLNPALDWSTVQLTEIVYGDQVAALPAGGLPFTVRDLPRGSVITGSVQGALAVDISADLNAQTGRLDWRMQAIDTATGLPPEDALAGFLPPEDGTGRGQGHVSFSARPRADLAYGARITNTADIVFDTNPAIATNAVWNTVEQATADLSMSMSARPAAAAVGDAITFTALITNNGWAAAQDVAVVDTLPAGAELVSATPSQGACYGTATLICNLGAINWTGTAEIRVVAIARAAGEQRNAAVVTSSVLDTNTANNSASAVATATDAQSRYKAWLPCLRRS